MVKRISHRSSKARFRVRVPVESPFNMNEPTPIICHPSLIPKDINRDRLFSWPYVYLHGMLEVHGSKDHAPDIFLSNIKFEAVNDGITECLFYTLNGLVDAEAFIWSRGEIEFRDQSYHTKYTRREGLIINPLYPDDYAHAYASFERKCK